MSLQRYEFSYIFVVILLVSLKPKMWFHVGFFLGLPIKKIMWLPKKIMCLLKNCSINNHIYNSTCNNKRNDCMHDNNTHECLMTLGYLKHSTRLILSPSMYCMWGALYISCVRGQKRVVLYSTYPIRIVLAIPGTQKYIYRTS